MDSVLYGHNSDERIVAVHQQDDRTMRIYFRQDDSVTHEDAEFFPFFFLAERDLLRGFSKKHWLKKLDGDAYFQYLCVFEEWSVLWEAIRHMLDTHNKNATTPAQSYTELEQIHLLIDPSAQYLMQSGRTLFKGMAFEQLYRMQLDIETYSGGASRFSNARRESDRIILIALSDNTGWSTVINGKKLSEKQMLEHLVSVINDKNPDVIEGHNIYNFDLPYLLKRCEMHKVPFLIGRDGAAPRSFETRTTFADRSFEYTAAEIAGRHIIDTMLLVQNYDMMKRNMESYGLKYAARYFGLAASDRTYIPGERISWFWDNEPKALIDYALDDVTETRKLSEHLSGTAFYLTQMLPYNYGTVARLGSAAKIESLLVREYLRRKHSVPKPSIGSQTTGGYTDIFVTGVVGPVLHADVESLYPSIMIHKGVSPSSDAVGVFKHLLSILTSSRLETKKAMFAATAAEDRSKLDARQSSLKILINSFYGYLGYSRGLFNDYRQADVVTNTGQSLLRNMIDFIRTEGGTVIEVDTDGIFFVPPGNIGSVEDEAKFVEKLSASMPAGINVALSGRYKKMLSYKMKNYALLDYDNKIRIKGSSLISRSIERFGRTYIHRCIDCLLRDDYDGLHVLYNLVRSDILEHKWDVRDFARTETLKDSIAEYKREVEAGRRTRSAAYEVASKVGRDFKTGDSISYYVTGTDANTKTSENCKWVNEWNPNFPDENSAYYLRRLDEFSDKFREFFEPKHFRDIFSPDDLFPFSAEGIRTITREYAHPAVEFDHTPPTDEHDLSDD